MEDVSFSTRLKMLRERRKWSQIDLAKALKVQQSTVSRWESGISQPVGLYANVHAIVARLERNAR